MSKSVTASRVCELGLTYRPFDRPRQYVLIDVMSVLLARARIRGPLIGREDVLPTPCPARLGILAFQGTWQVDLSESRRQVSFLQGLSFCRCTLSGAVVICGSIVTRPLLAFPIPH